MKITRRFTTAGQSPYATMPFRRATSEIKNPDGSVVFRLAGFDVPEHFSQVAADILAQKYFRKAGVARAFKKFEETQVPSWLWRSIPDEAALAKLPEKERFGGESDAREVFDRLAGTWTYWGWKGGYFTCEDDARAFFDEHRYMLAMQMAAPNSPQWFNTGLHWAYGIDGPGQGHMYVDQQATLEPGDIISTGTPAGVAAGRKPHETPWYLQPGDVIESEVEHIGLLRNRIVQETSQAATWNWNTQPA